MLAMMAAPAGHGGEQVIPDVVNERALLCDPLPGPPGCVRRSGHADHRSSRRAVAIRRRYIAKDW
jgi:hypothetical protein